MARKFVPRQRKRKVLDRHRAQERTTRAHSDLDANNLDPNAAIIAPEAQKRVRLRQELKPEGVKFSGKKAKRLEKYIENKLKKDENR